MIVKGFEKANKRRGDGEDERCLASRMSGKESVKDKGVLRKLGRVMGVVQSKQVDVDLVWKLKFMNKFIAKIIEAGKEVAQSAKNMPKSQENKSIF